MNQLSVIPTRPEPRMRWRRAFRALQEVLREPDDVVDKAQDVTLAIGARGMERHFQRFVSSAAGQRLLERRPHLVEALSDREALERLDAASLGRAYLRYIDENDFAPGYLIKVRRTSHDRWVREEGMTPLDPLRAWFQDRTVLSHDLFHVVTGYPTDAVGEAVLLAFTFAQMPGSAGALLTLGAALEVAQRRLAPTRRAWAAQVYRAWRRGRRASWLLVAPWEVLLPEPLEKVRRQLGVA